MEEESLVTVMEDLANLLTELRVEGFENLQVEVLATALIELRDNPNKSIKDCLNYGFHEWIK